MSDFFPFALIRKGEENFHFIETPNPIINQFEYRNKDYLVSDILRQTETTGFIVVKDDTIVYEKYPKGHSKDDLHISWSVNKSFVSALIGIALDESLINSLSDPISDYVPELKGTGYDGVPIEHILQMSSGVAFNEDYRDFFSDINRMGRVVALGHSINQFAASLKSEKQSGTFQHYVSMDTQVLGMLIKSVTNTTPAKYLEEKIWKRLGMRSNATWLTDDQGMELAFGTLNVTLRDYARFGILYRDFGRWQDEQIVPQQWITDSIKPAATISSALDKQSEQFGYGYQWWLPPHSQGDYLARGVYGQYIYINPEHGVVIVKTSADPDWREGSQENFITVKMFQAISQQLNKASLSLSAISNQ